MKNKTLLVLNGPGLADSILDDDVTLEQIRLACSELCAELDVALDFRQSDDQDEMCRWIAGDSDLFDALIINPAGQAQSGTVDHDKYHSAIESISTSGKPVVEVRLENIFQNGTESTRPLQGPEGTMGFACGLGMHSYLLGIRAAAERLRA